MTKEQAVALAASLSEASIYPPGDSPLAEVITLDGPMTLRLSDDWGGGGGWDIEYVGTGPTMWIAVPSLDKASVQ